ncbi:MAG: hypothetical protein PWQ70_2096 [Clostridiales bacterium]|jgi:hypothetical protein|nr:hypothetical protein [Clostridiales bacterium]
MNERDCYICYFARYSVIGKIRYVYNTFCIICFLLIMQVNSMKHGGVPRLHRFMDFTLGVESIFC